MDSIRNIFGGELTIKFILKYDLGSQKRLLELKMADSSTSSLTAPDNAVDFAYSRPRFRKHKKIRADDRDNASQTLRVRMTSSRTSIDRF